MLTVVTPATNFNLTTLADVKAELGLTDSTQDALLSSLIQRASRAVVNYCQVGEFAQQSYTETLPAYNTNWLVVSRTPIVSVSQITYDGGVIDPAQYTVERPLAGMIFSPTPWFWTAEMGVVLGMDVLPNSELRRYQVNYVAGYNLPDDATQTTPLPFDISEATIETVHAWFYARQRDPYLVMERVGDLQLQYAQPQGRLALPPGAMDLLSNYARVA